MEEEFSVFNRKDFRTRGRLVTLLVIGVGMFAFSLYQLSMLRATSDELLPVAGILEQADTYYTTVTDRRGHSSQKAELVFYLAGVKKKFALAENIGDNYTLPAYEQIKQGLDRSDSITVWIRQDEVSYWEPKVFGITADMQILLAFETVKFKDRPIVLMFLLGGLGCMALPVYVFFHKAFRRR